MPPKMRPYQSEQDYQRLRALLRAVLPLNAMQQRSWHVARLDYWRWHGVANITHDRLEDVVFLWETTNGDLVAALHPEGQGEAFLQVHPQQRDERLEAEMLAVAEEQLAVSGPDGQRRLCVWACTDDELRRALLRRRGYRPQGQPEAMRWRDLSAPIPPAPPPDGLVVRTLGDEDELPARSWVSWRAFHPDEPDEHYQGWQWYRNVQSAPLYRRDLDVVIADPEGAHVAFCTVWFDDVTRTGMFDPVGVDPAWQRRGLGTVVVCEGLRRLKALGATLGYIGSYSTAAGGLYASVGFESYASLEPWVRVW